MPLADWEWEYNGLIFGGDNVFGVVSVEGIDPPPTKESIHSKTGAHGASAFVQFFQERRVIIEGDFIVTGSVEPHINTLRTAFAPRTDDLPLTYKLPGVNRRRINCRPLRLYVPVRSGYDLGWGTWLVELVAGDPAIYDDVTGLKIFDG